MTTLSIPQAVKHSRIGRNTIREAIRTGDLRSCQRTPGSRQRVTTEAWIADWLERKANRERVAPPPKPDEHWQDAPDEDWDTIFKEALAEAHRQKREVQRG